MFPSHDQWVPKAQFLRKEIRKEIENLEVRYLDNNTVSQVYITGLSPDVKEKIQAIAKDIGITPNSYYKILLYQISKKYPGNMKKPNKGLNLDD